MEAKKKRLTLDLDPPLQRRLKVVAALKGISMRQYCQTAIDKELARDEAQTVEGLPFGRGGIRSSRYAQDGDIRRQGAFWRLDGAYPRSP